MCKLISFWLLRPDFLLVDFGNLFADLGSGDQNKSSENDQFHWSYAHADLRLCWSHIPHCWKSHVAAQLYFRQYYVFLLDVPVHRSSVKSVNENECFAKICYRNINTFRKCLITMSHDNRNRILLHFVNAQMNMV